MSSNAMSLKGRIKNYAKNNNIAAQVVLQNYMFERFLERLSVSEYSEKFVVKGGMHIAKLNGRLCGAKRPHSVSEQPNFYQSLQSNPYNDSSHPSGGE